MDRMSGWRDAHNVQPAIRISIIAIMTQVILARADFGSCSLTGVSHLGFSFAISASQLPT